MGIVIVKRRGHKQDFDDKKLYASVYFACKSAELESKKCEAISQKVLKKIKSKLQKKKTINSNELFALTGIEIEILDKHAAFMYLTHRDIS